MPEPVFETLLVIGGKPVEAAGHLRRLQNTADVDAADFLQKTVAGLRGYQRLRIDFTPPKSLTATHKAIPMPGLLRGELEHFKLITKHLKDRRLNAGYGQHKIADRSELEALEAETAPALPLLVDGSGTILETVRHNVFIVEGKSLVTPLLDGRILPGVTRQTVLHEAQKLGLTCREEPLSLERAQASDGMFLTNATIGIGWVEQCDDKHWSEISPLVRSLHRALAKRWQSETA